MRVEGKEEGVIGKMAVGSVDQPVLMCRERLGSVEIGNIRGPRKKICGLAWPALSVCLYSVQLCFSCVGSGRDLQQGAVQR
jgi:hypothetical protein